MEQAKEDGSVMPYAVSARVSIQMAAVLFLHSGPKTVEMASAACQVISSRNLLAHKSC